MEPQKDNKIPYQSHPNKPVLELYLKDNASLLYIYKKTERIVSALYLISNLFAEQEPLRGTLRDKALCLLSSVLEYKNNQKNSPFLDFAAIVSYLGVARDAGFMSAMNYQIITQEIDAVVGLLYMYETKLIQEPYFGQSFFQVGLPLPKIEKASVQSFIKDMSYKGHKNVLYNPTTQKATGISKNNAIPVKDIKDDRRQKILDIVKQKGVCSIKDFSYVITEFSEKTLQRELGALVAEGVLKKEGEKRWSTYRLASV